MLNDVVELDIWLAERRVAGHGYGSESLVVLCDWLQVNYGVNRFLARPSRRNVKALRAMRRAGFRETDLPAQEVAAKLSLPAGHYADELLLFRILPVPSAVFRPDPSETYVFIDSEFTDLTAPQLISVGAVATDSTAFYAELEGWDPAPASPFVHDTVIPLLDGDAVPKAMGAEALTEWLLERARKMPTTIISDSGFDRWALSELFGSEQLPPNVQWRRVPIAYEALDEATQRLNLQAASRARRCARIAAPRAGSGRAGSGLKPLAAVEHRGAVHASGANALRAPHWPCAAETPRRWRAAG